MEHRGVAGGRPPGPTESAGGTAAEPAGAPVTGDARVDEAVARLTDLAGLPVAEHPPVFEYVHERLTEALGDLDVRDPAGPGNPSGPGSRPPTPGGPDG